MFSLLASLVKQNDGFSLHKQLCYFKEPDAVKVMLCVSLTHFPAFNISQSLDICVIPFITGQDTKPRMASDIDWRRSTLLVSPFLALFQGFFFSAFLSLLLALLKWLILSICSNSLLFFKNNSWEMCVPWILLNVLPSLCVSWFWFLTGYLSTLHAHARLCLCRVII